MVFRAFSAQLNVLEKVGDNTLDRIKRLSFLKMPVDHGAQEKNVTGRVRMLRENEHRSPMDHN